MATVSIIGKVSLDPFFFSSVGDFKFQFLVLEIKETYISDQIDFLNF